MPIRIRPMRVEDVERVGGSATRRSLYASLGFDVKEPLAMIEGELKGDLPADVTVRAIEENT